MTKLAEKIIEKDKKLLAWVFQYATCFLEEIALEKNAPNELQHIDNTIDSINVLKLKLLGEE